MIGEAALSNGPPVSKPRAKLEREAFHFAL